MYSINCSTRTVTDKSGVAHIYNYESKKITVVGRLSGGQDVDKKKCPCSDKSSSPSWFYNQSTPLNRGWAECAPKRENRHFEEWQKNALSVEDQRAEMFCLCGDSGYGGKAAAAAADNRQEEPQSEFVRPGGTEPVVNLDTADDERAGIRLGAITPGHERNTTRSKSAPRIQLNANEGVKSNRSTVKRRRRTKRKCMCSQIARTEESFIGDVTAEQPMKTIHVIYPGVCCGHKNCQSEPVVTPKTMGWLWSVRETGGVRINRNWRPGAIPKNVAVLMERVRAEMAGEMGRLHMKVTPPTTFNNQYTSSNWSRTTAESNKKVRSSRTTAIMSDDQKSMQLQNNNNNNNNTADNDPVFVMNKHKGQYGIKMNPMSYKNSYGVSKNEEPVQIRLGPHSARNTTISSQSSMEFELIPQNVLNKEK